MDREFSDELTGLMPVVPHASGGVECPGCIVAEVEDGHVELRCQKCGQIVGVVQVGIMEGLLGLDSDHVACPFCGTWQELPEAGGSPSFACRTCGRNVVV